MATTAPSFLRQKNARVLWDFDHTLISVNSDTWIPAQYGPVFKNLIDAGKAAGVPWTELMARVAVSMYGEDITVAMISLSAAELPVEDAILSAIRETAHAGVSQHIVSDANSLYIKAFLKARDLAPLFASIATNPATISAEGCIMIAPAVPRETPHACPLCPPNLCKGGVIRARGWATDSGRTIYIGDGGGDECPSRALRKGDLVLARGGFPLASLLAQQPPAAAVLIWNDAAALRAALADAIKL